MAGQVTPGADRTSRELVDVTGPDCWLSRHDPDASHCRAFGHVIYHVPDAPP